MNDHLNDHMNEYNASDNVVVFKKQEEIKYMIEIIFY